MTNIRWLLSALKTELGDGFLVFLIWILFHTPVSPKESEMRPPIFFG